MIHSYTDKTKTHAGIKRYPDVDLEPGYLSLVNKEAIEKFRASAAPSEYRNMFSMPGCSSWFAPTALNAAGDRCLDAHIQIARSPIGCEPGLHAFKQFVEKGSATFKDGHQLHVIFVSDEVGPGCNNEELKAKCPTAAALKSAALANTKNLIDVRFHGIINESDSKGCDYENVITENKGKQLDIQSAAVSSYKDIIESIVKERINTVGTFKLAKPAREIIAILVNGKPYTGESFIAGDKVTLKDLPDMDTVDVRIKYIVK